MQVDLSTDRVVSSSHIGHRYSVRALLGHGGMARVYHVVDEITGHELALKQWHASSVSGSALDARARKQSVAQFEYEYLTLAQLDHPCMIEVYDYGLHERGPYFTMELLDGGDLRDHAPLPWRRACHVFYDICSSLALLHSRRLIHRDISPRNIRCTRHGDAKLIDFGAMLPMGFCEQVVGTPAFSAPEVVQGLPLDARVDLFSLGATLYFALTGKQPSGARDFSEVLELAQTKPPAPSGLAPDVPHALDSLVLSMLDPDPNLRPRSAFDVMQRLATIAELPGREPLRVTQAYLSTPELVGRDAVLTRVRERCADALCGRGGTLILEGAVGMGRSRVLDVCALWAKTLGANVLRGRGGALPGSERPLWHKLAEQLMAAVPSELGHELRQREPHFDALFEATPRHENTAVVSTGTAHAQRAIRMRSARSTGIVRCREQLAVQRCLIGASQRTPLVIAVDDAHACDAESIALLAELAQEAPESALLLLLTHDPFAANGGAGASWQQARHTQHAQRMLHERAERLTLNPLTREQTARLFSSVFGDVPNVALLADRVQTVSAGKPGAALELAQNLVDRGLLRYEAGSWTLPSSLEVADLPPCAADGLRLSSLSALARELATAQALSLHDGFTRADYLELAALTSGREGVVDDALMELVRQRVIEAERGVYSLTQSAWAKLLVASLGDSELRERHERLASYCARKHGPALHLVHHLLCAGEESAALDRIVETLKGLGDNLDFELFSATQTSPEQTASILLRCLSAACARGRPRWQEQLLRRWLTMLSVLTRDDYYLIAAPGWRSQLEHDAGLSLATAANQNALPADGMEILRRAELRYARTPEHERVYSPLEALRHLVSYVSCSLAVAGRRLDPELTASLPALLEPFADLAPEIHAVWQIALGAEQSLCRCQVDQARARWLEVHEYLSQLPASTLDHLSFIRNAVAYAIGATEVSMGIQSAARWPDELDKDPLHSVNAMYLRKLLRLQLGDFEGAERFRRKAELLSLQADTTQMFTSTVVMELVVHGMGGDLLGVKQLADRIAPLAEQSPSWRPYLALASGYFEKLRGNPAAALAAFERCLELSAPSSAGHFGFAWPLATAGLAEVLIELGHPAQAARLARATLARCRKSGVLWLSHLVVRALALAEAKLGHYAHAAELLDASIESARVRGVSGLPLGSLYEARAFVAIEASDPAALDRYAQLTAREYRYGLGSSLGARCERLLEVAARRQSPLLQPVAAWGGALHAHAKTERVTQLGAEVTRAMHGAEQAEGRALRALRLLCDSHGADAGHLYLAGEHGLRWAASHGVPAPAPELLDAAFAQLHADLRQRADITRVSGDTHLRLGEARGALTDGEGRAFEPRILHCVRGGTPRCAGIALLARPQGAPRPTRPAQFASAIGAYLIDSGETVGI